MLAEFFYRFLSSYNDLNRIIPLLIFYHIKLSAPCDNKRTFFVITNVFSRYTLIPTSEWQLSDQEFQNAETFILPRACYKFKTQGTQIA